ncbi:MAG TPA: VRR-NUC domain-containing protein [Noviherbaspirillum sp.]|nr:VRR-NUC domain-containing protein [Noviherbaspirillum sp.]
MSEHAHQCAIVAWSRLPAVKAQYPGIELLHSSLNGVKLTKGQAGKAKAAGMLSGVPDLLLPVRRGPYAGLAIEMKYGRNKPTDEQEWFLGRLREEGWRTEVCYDWIAARNVIIEFLSQQDLFADGGLCRGCGGAKTEPNAVK